MDHRREARLALPVHFDSAQGSPPRRNLHLIRLYLVVSCGGELLQHIIEAWSQIGDLLSVRDSAYGIRRS